MDFNTYYYSGAAVPQIQWEANWYTLAELVAATVFENDGEVADPGFTDVDNDDFTLTEATSPGEDLSGDIGTVTILGVTYCSVACDDNTLDYKWGLNPDTTDWTTIPPTVNVLDRDDHVWSRGAYVFPTSGIIPIVLRQFFLD